MVHIRSYHLTLSSEATFEYKSFCLLLDLVQKKKEILLIIMVFF